MFFGIWIGCFVRSSSIYEILLAVFHMKEQGFRFIGYRCNDKWKVFSDVVDNSLNTLMGSPGVLVASVIVLLLGEATRMAFWS